MKKIEKNTKKLLKNAAVSGVIYFSVILLMSYFSFVRILPSRCAMLLFPR